jgi:Family of unknown function (DUF5335)
MAAEAQEIPRPAWREYFDEFSKTMGATEATIEITGPDVGDQIAADGVAVTGITYDDKDDILVVALDAPGGSPEEYEHMIDSPQEIYAAADEDETTFDVKDPEGRQHLIRLKPVPALPPA